MGLQQKMGLPSPRLGRLQRFLQKIGATRVGTALLFPIVGPLDRLTYRITRGRTTAARALGGFPVVLLTTTGARSGQLRTVPINAIPFDGGLALVGTNAGKGVVPAWAHNLRANAGATLTFAECAWPVVATEAEGETRSEIFAAAIAVYPGYARYKRKWSEPIPIFILNSSEES